MTRVKVERLSDVIYLALVGGAIGLMLNGIINQNIGIMLTGIPELLLVLIGLRCWPRYTKQRWEYLRTIVMGLGVSLPLGITIAMISHIPSKEKLLLIGIFAAIHVLAIAVVLNVRAKFINEVKEEGSL